MTARNLELNQFLEQEYPAGWSTEIAEESAPPGLSEDTVRFISARKEEPSWLLEWRLKALRHLARMQEPSWPNVRYTPVDLQSIVYYSAPKKRPKLNSLDEADPELIRTFEKLGIPLEEQKIPGRRGRGRGVRQRLGGDDLQGETQRAGHRLLLDVRGDPRAPGPGSAVSRLGRPVQRQLLRHPEQRGVQRRLLRLRAPKGVRCPMELSTYFRINAQNTGQFERTLIIADEGAYVSYLEGCTAPMRDENQLHAAVVELVALTGPRSSTPPSRTGIPATRTAGGIYNFVTKRGRQAAPLAKITWTQVETGSAITWKYPS
jgi:Fe-S cluster assembly protein SufB